MANSWFAFKQFRIEQGNCGMKVSTDACIQGAWTPVSQGSCRIFDLGAGTGLLSLMMAQRAPEALIDALEIDEAAAAQALENVQLSPFAERICIHNADARTWMPEMHYDVVICNPPFFINSLEGPEAARNLARHNGTLQQQDMVQFFDRVLRPDGYAAVLLPLQEDVLFRKLMEQHSWHAAQSLAVKDHAAAAVKRKITIYRRGPQVEVAKMLIIKNQHGSYTDAFAELLRPFYLHL